MEQNWWELVRRPALWQRSAEPFWNDPHISKGMLQAHLDPDTDAASRRPAVIEASAAWIAGRIPRGGSILDLGCGPGLYTKRFAELGFDVTGIDCSERSIGYARAADPKTNYICRDYLTLDGAEAYDAITLIYCDYAALTKPERERLLSIVRRLLRPGGWFLFDVFTDVHFQRKRECTSWYCCENGGFWSAAPHICLEATHLYENNTVAADQYVVLTQDRAKEYIVWDTAYTKQRLIAEVQASGLFVEAVLADVCGGAYREDSETLCCIAVKQPGTGLSFSG